MNDSVTAAGLRAKGEEITMRLADIHERGRGLGYDVQRMRECYSDTNALIEDALSLLTAAAGQLDTATGLIGRTTRERDNARAEIEQLHQISLDVMEERDQARAALVAAEAQTKERTSTILALRDFIRVAADKFKALGLEHALRP